MRWDLLDKFEIIRRGDYARAVKAYSGKEDFFSEHHPGRPFVPESLLIEMIAQTGGVLFGLGFDFSKEVILAKIERASFGEPVPAPCRLAIDARVEDEREDGAWIRGVVSCEGRPVADVKLLLFALTELSGTPREKIVFNDHFLEHFDVFNIASASGAKS